MMLAQRKSDFWEEESVQQSYTTNNVKRKIKLVKKAPQNLNNQLRNICLLMFCIISVLAGFFIYRNGVATSSAYNLNQVKKQAATLEAQNARLHLDIAQLKSPERIQSIATYELGMILPDKFFFSTKQ